MLLTLSDHFTLRILTGRVVGKAIGKLFGGNIGIILPKNFICTSFASAFLTAYLESQDNLALIDTFVVEKDKDIELSQLETFVRNKDMIILAFGGEDSLDVNRGMVRKVLLAFKNLNYDGGLFYHVRIWAPGIIKDLYNQEKDIREYLEELPFRHMTFTFDLEKGIFILNDVIFEDSNITVIPIKEMPLTYQHLELLKASL